MTWWMWNKAPRWPEGVMYNQTLLYVVRSACGPRSQRACVWNGLGWGMSHGDQEDESRRRGGKREKSGWTTSRRVRQEASTGWVWGDSSISITLPQLTQLFWCPKFPLRSLHDLLSANHFSFLFSSLSYSKSLMKWKYGWRKEIFIIKLFWEYRQQSRPPVRVDPTLCLASLSLSHFRTNTAQEFYEPPRIHKENRIRGRVL